MRDEREECGLYASILKWVCRRRRQTAVCDVAQFKAARRAVEPSQAFPRVGQAKPFLPGPVHPRLRQESRSIAHGPVSWRERLAALLTNYSFASSVEPFALDSGGFGF
jgi:hypothetical protein